MYTEKELILEQYKLYVQMADYINKRRNTNQFYLSLLSILIGIPVIIKTFIFSVDSVLSISFAIFGIVLCILWINNIKSHRQLNSGKFQVIHEIEKELPFKRYKKEWELLGEGRNKKRYSQLSIVEQFVPYLLFLPFIMLLLVSIYNFL